MGRGLSAFLFLLLMVSFLQANSAYSKSQSESDFLQKALSECLALSEAHQAKAFDDERGFTCMLDEVPDGPILRRDKEGHLTATGRMTEGKMIGNWSRYQSNGNKRDQGDWIEGVPEGKWSFFHENGTTKSRGRMRGGRQVCVWEHWDPDGKVLPVTTEEIPSEGCGGGTAQSTSSSNSNLNETSAPAPQDHWYALGELSGTFAAVASGGWGIAGDATWTPRILNHTLPLDLALLGRLSLSWMASAGSSTVPTLGYAIGIERGISSALNLQLSAGARTVVTGSTGPELGLELVIHPERWGSKWMDRLLEGIVLRQSFFFYPSISVIQETSFGLRWRWRNG